MTLWKTRLFSALTVVFAITLVFGAGEILVRVFAVPQTVLAPPATRTIDPYQPNPYMQFARPYIHFSIPKSKYVAARSSYSVEYSINSGGFRGPEPGELRSSDSRRLLIVGDSITEGHGVSFNKTFSSDLATSLQQVGWEVMNAGTQGGSPIYYAANLPRYLALEPDAILLLLFENDLYDDRMQETRYFTIPMLDNETSLLMGHGESAPWSASQLIIWLRRSWRSYIRSSLEGIIQENNTIDISAAEADSQPSPFLIPPSTFDQHWAMTERHLNYFVNTLEQRSIKVLISVFALGSLGPGLPEVYGAHAHTLESKAAQWASKRSLPFLSLLPLTEEAFSKHTHDRVMIEDDGHPTEMMHQLMASFLDPWLQENLQ